MSSPYESDKFTNVDADFDGQPTGGVIVWLVGALVFAAVAVASYITP